MGVEKITTTRDFWLDLVVVCFVCVLSGCGRRNVCTEYDTQGAGSAREARDTKARGNWVWVVAAASSNHRTQAYYHLLCGVNNGIHPNND